MFHLTIGFLLLLGVTYALLQSSYVQTYLVNYITHRIESETGVKVKIGGVDFRPVRSLVLNDVLVRDFRNDTLLYCKDLSVRADSFSFSDRRFVVQEVMFDEATFNLWVQDGTNLTNIEILMDSLSGGASETVEPVEKEPRNQDQKAEKKDWWFGLRKIAMRNSRFTYKEEIFIPEEYGVNWTDVDCRDLNVDLTDLNFWDSPTRMKVSGLSFKEKSGLTVKDMGGQVRAGASNLLITDCHIGLERSNVDLVKLEYNWTPDQHDWKYFTTRMQQYYEIGPSEVSFIDLAYFNGILRGITNTVKCSGVVSNTIEHLEGRDLYFELGDHTVFQGKFKSLGLPDVWNTMFDIDLTSAHLAPEDLATVYLPWFEMKIPVPSFLYHVPFLDFKYIRFDGLFSDFIVRAKSISPALDGDFNFIYKLHEDEKPEWADLRGDFDFHSVDFGRFSGFPVLGYGMYSGEYKGTWKDEGPAVHLKSRVPWLICNRNVVRDLGIALTYDNDQMHMLASVDDRNVKADVVVSYDMDEDMQFSSVKGRVDVADLDRLGMGLLEGKENFRTGFDYLYAGRSDGNNYSKLRLDDICYGAGEHSFAIDRISMEDQRRDGIDMTVVSSDVLDMMIRGDYKDVKPMVFMQELIGSYLPDYFDVKKQLCRKGRKYLDQFNFDYTIDFKDINRVLEVMVPELRIADGTSLSSSFNNEDGRLFLDVVSDSVSYDNIKLEYPVIKGIGTLRDLKLKINIDRAAYGDSYQLGNLKYDLRLSETLWENRLHWSNWGEKTYSGALSADVAFDTQENNVHTAALSLYPSVIMMDDSVWNIAGASAFFKDKDITIRNFEIRHQGESLSMNGMISENPEKNLDIELKDFNLSDFFRIVWNGNLGLFGRMNGSFVLSDVYRNFLLMSDFNIAPWGIMQDTLGSLNLRSYWDADKNSMLLKAENLMYGSPSLSVNGLYNPETDSMKMYVEMQKLQLKRFERYVEEFAGDLQGGLSGNLSLEGILDSPDISGKIVLDSVGMNIKALNTRFAVNDVVHVKNSRLLLDNLKLYDSKGHSAILEGEYNLLKDSYRLKTVFDNIQVLNTLPSDEDLFYGNVNLSGLAEIHNMSGIPSITVNARTEVGSKLFVPLKAAATEERTNFLHFIGGPEETAREQQTVRMDNMDLNANLELNDDLGVQVIFDPTVGDILRANGKGNIKIALDKDGNLNMFGEYSITKGNYLFTLSNLVNKKFVLTPGGTITWSGSPYDAMVDINAVYNLKTSIAELLPVEGNGHEGDKDNVAESRRKVPVECILNLTDNITNPKVKFDIDFPSLESQSKSYIQSLFSSQDEVNKQMFSLLVLNRFYRPDNTGNYGSQAQTMGMTTVTEMMSNQLSNWLSQISNKVDIGVAYRMGDLENEISSDEIELALSTHLLNDRVTISANGNMDVGGNKNIGNDRQKTNIAGDFDVEVKLNKQGNLKLKAYSHTNEKILYNSTEMIQGVGVSYQETFDTLRELIRKYFAFLHRKRKVD